MQACLVVLSCFLVWIRFAFMSLFSPLILVAHLVASHIGAHVDCYCRLCMLMSDVCLCRVVV